ncbi:hypothetical protein HF521_006755 [Silurus meridionalis]|uniref:SUEL-type lectin domain-containing protein n=1 Tax=Silurus meridionalis TaxID=175797 RepID=A0A8T0AS84_SILME|nr:hypothetical protein HF521_006755 [Silurus meridionalis]
MMLFLKFTLLALLIAALDLRVSGVTVITCDGKVQRLACASGVIQVASTIYGRTNRNTCTFNRQPFGCARTNCAMGTSVIADRCNGLKTCVVNTKSLRISDPCYGTYKYYTTTYNCVQGRVAVICQRGQKTLNCGHNIIQIIKATYGRDDSGTCIKRKFFLPKRTNCNAPRASATVASLCNGRTRCTLKATNRVFSNPCIGVPKYLTVSYRCNPAPRHTVTCEGNNAVLACGAHRIRIISANYGRTDSLTCAAGRPHQQITRANCYTPWALGQMVARCGGRNICVVPATNGVFSDPCVGTYKYLRVSYNCSSFMTVVKHYIFSLNLNTYSITMVLLLVTLLTFLIAAPDLRVSGKTVITCDGHVQHLSCATGVIQVTSTVFGRTSRQFCTLNRPASQFARTNCALRTSAIASRCNGRRNCEVKTDLLGSPDPCYGTYKYYQTTYNCITGREVVICEQGYRTLSCGDNMIQIINANYGRSDSKTCSNGLPAHLTQNTNCYAPRTYSIVASNCNGRRSCQVEASYKIFTDPCVGISKYLTVSYRCISVQRLSVTCEGRNAVLTCGARRIRIVSANYGRTDPLTCTAGKRHIRHYNRNCYARNTLKKIVARCGGQNTCVVPATNRVFSDPCFGTYKYLRVVYYCV